ncbi:MAG: cytochrome-c peroxidase [Persicimonas sp.]
MALIFMVACGDDPSQNNNEGGDEEELPRVVESEFGTYHVRFSPSVDPVPFNEFFELSVEVFEDEDLEEPAEDVDLEFDARVEELNGRLPTAPTVESIGGGEFEVEGVMLHVPRRWELRFEFDEDGLTERAVGLVDPRSGFETGEDPTGFFDDDEVRRILSFSPEGGPELPESPSNRYADDPDAARFGQFAFFDERFSEGEAVSCATCHVPEEGFADGAKLGTGLDEVDRNTPTLLNAAYSRWQFLDGRTDSLWSQALQPFEAEREHGFNRMKVVRTIAEDEEYRAAYEEIFGSLPDVADEERFPEDARPVPGDEEHPDHVAWREMSEEDRQAVNAVYANLGKAIAAYERKLVRLDAPFDAYADGLRTGDEAALDAISEEARAGLDLFLNDAQCDLCHNGPMLANDGFHNLGLRPREWMPDEDPGRSDGADQLVDDPFNAGGPFSDASEDEPDHLRYLRRDEQRQMGAFKTSTLRNIELTGPYMHGGHFDNLSELIRFYGDLQEDPVVGRRDPLVQPFSVNSEEVDQLEAFMETLTGEPLDDELKEQPDSPLSE